MRSSVDPSRIHELLRELGRLAKGPGRIYLTGGASALLEGWRDSTVDVDLKLDPEPPGIFEAIAKLKNSLDVNVELSSPDQFLPPLPDWRSRSPYIARHGQVEFFHYDFRAQALSKLGRGHARDLDDVRAMVERELFDRKELWTAWEAIQKDVIRYPALDVEALEKRLRALVQEDDDG